MADEGLEHQRDRQRRTLRMIDSVRRPDDWGLDTLPWGAATDIDQDLAERHLREIADLFSADEPLAGALESLEAKHRSDTLHVALGQAAEGFITHGTHGGQEAYASLVQLSECLPQELDPALTPPVEAALRRFRVLLALADLYTAPGP